MVLRKAKKKPRHDEFFNILQQSDMREHDIKTKTFEFQKNRLQLQQKVMELREKSFDLEKKTTHTHVKRKKNC